MRFISLLLTTCFVFFLFPKISHAAISLTISNPQKQDSFYSVEALVSGIASSSACFVQVVLTAPDSPHYFGQTWGTKGEWFKYQSSPESSFIKDNFIELKNDQSVKILFNSDPEDKDYLGPGSYLLKLKRYTGNSSSSAGESNSLTVDISDPLVPTSTSAPTSTQTPTSTPTPTAASTPSNPPTRTPTPNATHTSVPTRVSQPKPTIIATASAAPKILGETTFSAILSSDSGTVLELTPSVSENKRSSANNSKTFFFVGIFLLTVSGTWLYFRHRTD